MAVATKATPAAADDKELLISGSEAVAEALTLADIDVVTAYPIRPYDTVMQAIAKKIANGQLVAEYIVAEGEHSQFEIVKHASTVGARVFCGSSGVGWAYAMECLVVTPPLRVPMVGLVGNRALDDPGAFGVEHNDALFVRDLGGMLCWIDTPQEALDTTLIAYRVWGDRRRGLPQGLRARAGQSVVRGVHDGRRGRHPRRDGNDLAADEGRHPEHARAGQEGRSAAVALVPAVPDGEDRGGALEGQGHRDRGPGLLVRLTVQFRRGGQRDPRRALQLGEAAAPPQLHLRPRRPRSDAGRRLQGDGPLLCCRELRQVGRQDALARRAGIGRTTDGRHDDVQQHDAGPGAVPGHQEGHDRGILHLRAPD